MKAGYEYCVHHIFVTMNTDFWGILRNPDSKTTRTIRKPGLGLEKNPDSSMRKAGLAIRKAGSKLTKTGSETEFRIAKPCTRLYIARID